MTEKEIDDTILTAYDDATNSQNALFELRDHLKGMELLKLNGILMEFEGVFAYLKSLCDERDIDLE